MSKDWAALLNIDSNIFLDRTGSLSSQTVHALNKKFKLVYPHVVTREYRKPEIGDLYLMYDTATGNAVIATCDTVLNEDEIIVAEFVPANNFHKEFSLSKCLQEHGGEAYFRGQKVKVVTSVVDNDLRICILYNNAYNVVPVYELVNITNSGSSVIVSSKYWISDLKKFNTDRWKVIPS